MKTFFLIIAYTLAIAIGQDDNSPTLPQISDGSQNVINTGLNILNDAFNTDIAQNKFQRFLQVVDLKVRTIRFIRSLLTQENFVFLRRFLEVLSHTTGSIASFLPNPGDPANNLLQTALSKFSLPVEPKDPEELGTNDSQIPFRVNRQVIQNSLTKEEQDLIDTHRNQLNQLEKLLYRTP